MAQTERKIRDLGPCPGWPNDGRQWAVAWDCVSYVDYAQTTNNQTKTVRSFPLPPLKVFGFRVVATIINAVGDKAGQIVAQGAIARGPSGVFRPEVFNVVQTKNLGNSAVDVVANTGTQSADVQVAGTTNGAGIINWTVWTTVYAGGASP